MKKLMWIIVLVICMSTMVCAERLSSTEIIASVGDSNTTTTSTTSSSSSSDSSSGGTAHFVQCGDTVCGVNQYCEDEICKFVVSADIDNNTKVLDVTPIVETKECPVYNEKQCPSCKEPEQCEECEKQSKLPFYLMVAGILILISAVLYLLKEAETWKEKYENETNRGF